MPTPKFNGPGPIRGDFGLGLCVTCLNERFTALRQAASNGDAAPVAPVPLVQLAITMAPASLPVLDLRGNITGTMLVALPSCYDHLVNVSASEGPGLLVPRRG